MNKYTITGSPVRLVGGVLGLTEKQAAPRLHNLKALKKKGLFEIVQPVVFKAGEVIGFDGDIPKSQANLMESVDANKQKSEAELEAQKEAERLASEQTADEAEAARIAAEEEAKNQANSNQNS